MLSDLELATGHPLGQIAGQWTPPTAARQHTPRQALERSVRAVIADAAGPVVIAFSGGLDSSAVLAVANRVALDAGHDQPVACTLRFVGRPESDEHEWQELVVDHVRPADWTVLDLDDELDFIGPYAQPALRHHGTLWPANAHLIAPLLERWPGATVLTGLDGDGLFASWRWRHAAAVLARPLQMRPSDVRPVAMALLPPRFRRMELRGRDTSATPGWLTPGAASKFARAYRADWASEPLHWGARMRWYGARRYTWLASEATRRVADTWGGAVAHPFLDGTFIGALGHAGGRRGYRSRKELLAEVVGDLLPARLLARQSKATFSGAFFARHSRAFAEQWDGRGLPKGLVDPDRLRATWLEDRADWRCSASLQHAWCASADR